MPEFREEGLPEDDFFFWPLPRTGGTLGVRLIRFKKIVNSYVAWHLVLSRLELLTSISNGFGAILDFTECEVDWSHSVVLSDSLTKPIVCITRDFNDNLPNIGNVVFVNDLKNGFFQLMKHLQSVKMFKGNNYIMNLKHVKSIGNINMERVDYRDSISVNAWSLEGHSGLMTIKISGRIGVGSDGDEQAAECASKINFFTNAYHPSSVIIDARNLKYQWGDSVDLYPTNFSKTGDPVAFLTDPSMKKHYDHLIRSHQHFHDMNEALAFVVNQSNP